MFSISMFSLFCLSFCSVPSASFCFYAVLFLYSILSVFSSVLSALPCSAPALSCSAAEDFAVRRAGRPCVLTVLQGFVLLKLISSRRIMMIHERRGGGIRGGAPPADRSFRAFLQGSELESELFPAGKTGARSGPDMASNGSIIHSARIRKYNSSNRK